MNTHEALKNVPGVPPRPGFTLTTPRVVAGFVSFFAVGTLVVLFPFFTLGLVAAAGALACVWFGIRYLQRAGLEIWQMVLLFVLTGYLLLNYGFENLAVHVGGFPIIISYMLMFAALALAAFNHPYLGKIARQEPAVYCLLALLSLTFLHLIVDLPEYGLWAIRDASMFFDAVFLTLGLLWARRGASVTPLMKWLMVIFLLNSLYSLTMPWAETISAWSPTSGVFLQIPLLGNYRGNGLFLLLGSLFYIFLGQSVVRWPRWIIWLLVVVQFFGLAIHQARSMYVAFLLVAALLAVIGEKKKSGKLLLLLAPAVVGILILTTSGIEIPGRIGPVSADFFKEHFRSITGAQDTPGSSLEGRLSWYDQVFARIKRNPWLGEGFGQPLITFENELTGGAVRQPHNSTVTVLARLGIAGMLPWVAFHVCVMLRFIYAFRQRKKLDKQFADFMLWLFMVYLVFMLSAAVEATFEFPSAAIPFYFFVGLSLGLARWQIPHVARQTERAEAPRLVVA
jgi:O-antigen ligase